MLLRQLRLSPGPDLPHLAERGVAPDTHRLSGWTDAVRRYHPRFLDMVRLGEGMIRARDDERTMRQVEVLIGDYKRGG